MSLKPTCSLEEMSLEEVFKDLELVDSAYKKGKNHRFVKITRVRVSPSKHWVKAKEKELTRYLQENLIPIAKTLSYFKIIHCEPKEVCFSNLREGALGSRLLHSISINQCCYENINTIITIPSILSHETAHAFGAIFFDESLATLLGWEIDARMISAGYKRHRVSLFRRLRDSLAHVSYLKAKSIGRVDEWRDFIEKLYPNEITKEILDEEIAYFEKAEQGLFGMGLSDYTLAPYLVLKEAARANTEYVLDYYDLFGESKEEKIEIPALIKIWKKIVI